MTNNKNSKNYFDELFPKEQQSFNFRSSQLDNSKVYDALQDQNMSSYFRLTVVQKQLKKLKSAIKLQHKKQSMNLAQLIDKKLIKMNASAKEQQKIDKRLKMYVFDNLRHIKKIVPTQFAKDQNYIHSQLNKIERNFNHKINKLPALCNIKHAYTTKNIKNKSQVKYQIVSETSAKSDDSAEKIINNSEIIQEKKGDQRINTGGNHSVKHQALQGYLKQKKKETEFKLRNLKYFKEL